MLIYIYIYILSYKVFHTLLFQVVGMEMAVEIMEVEAVLIKEKIVQNIHLHAKVQGMLGSITSVRKPADYAAEVAMAEVIMVEVIIPM